MLSLPLKCVHYTVVDSKQKDGQILVVLCLLPNELFPQKALFPIKRIMVESWILISSDHIFGALMTEHFQLTYIFALMEVR